MVKINWAEVKIIDLKKEPKFVKQYVNLRNKYKDLLLSHPVKIRETEDWLINAEVEIRCLVSRDKLLGVVLLYLDKKGEITFFVSFPGKGVGTRLLQIIEDNAKKRKLPSVWAWVLASNIPAQKAFSKNGYIVEKETERIYKNKTLKGIVFRKEIIGI